MIQPHIKDHWRDYAALALCLIGSLQILGHITGVKVLKGFGVATAASPYPKVFSDVEGLEPFASEFTLHVKRKSGESWEKKITPEVYQKLKGPYNRRNVYGAALSYGPRLPKTLWESVFCYGFYTGAPLRTEMELPQDAEEVHVMIETKTKGRSDSWVLQPSCSE